MSRVLVVDDEASIRRALEVSLTARGYAVDLAADGEEALELVARVRAALRRATPVEETPVLETGHFRIDFVNKHVTAPDGEPIRLTPTEWQLIEILTRNPGKLIAPKQLLLEVWGPGYSQASNYLRVHMAHVRRKLEPDPSRPRYFHTEPAMGYRFVTDEP